MCKIRCFILIFGVLLFILNCAEKSTQPEIIPDPVQLIQSSSPFDKIERGIDAVPDVDGIYLEWHDTDDPSVEFYEIYRGEDPEDRFIPVGKIFHPDTSFQDEEVELFTRYYYYVLAVSDLDARSESSDTLDYTLLAKPTNLSPSGIWQDVTPLLRWDNVQEDQYLVRIEDDLLDEIVWMKVVQSSYGETESVEVGHDTTAIVQIDSLSRQRDYIWRVDVIRDVNNIGSESNWKSLRIE